MRTFTSLEAAVELNVDTSRILYLCRQGRLGYTVPKHGQNWIITDGEIIAYKAIGPLRPGKKPKPKQPRLSRIGGKGEPHEYV